MASGLDMFVNDVDETVEKLKKGLESEHYGKLLRLKDRLIQLHEKNVVKINHSVMELVCSKSFIQKGFDVEIEYTLNGVSCDIYALKGLGSIIVEVETGFVPPEHALDPQQYLLARVVSKITRYSGYANKFCLSTPTHYIMQIPPALTKPPRFRTKKEVAIIKNLCDQYYKNPPVTIEEIRNARLHAIYTLDVDKSSVKEWEVSEYLGKATLWSI